MREKFSCIDLRQSNAKNLFLDFLAYLHVDNYCFQMLRNCKGMKPLNIISERTFTWLFPLTDVKVVTRKEVYGNREDTVWHRTKLEYRRIEYKLINKYLDQDVGGIHMAAIYNNELVWPLISFYYFKTKFLKQSSSLERANLFLEKIHEKPIFSKLDPKY